VIESDKKLSHKLPNEQTNFLILNSLSFFEKSRKLMEQHDKIYLYLDHDKAAQQATQQTLKRSIKYIDKCHCYKYCKDLNEYLIKQGDQEQLISHHKVRMEF
jgi:hypothetical protein